MFHLSCLQDDGTVPGVTAGTIRSHESREEMHRSDFGKQTTHKNITSVTVWKQEKATNLTKSLHETESNQIKYILRGVQGVIINIQNPIRTVPDIS